MSNEGQSQYGICNMQNGKNFLEKKVSHTEELLFLLDKCVRFAVGAGATGATDAVHVVVVGVGLVKVDDVADVGYVETACGDISRDQYFGTARLKRVESTLALRLRFVAVNGFAGKTRFVERVTQTLCPVFGFAKHQHALKRFVAEHVGEQFYFVGFVGGGNHVLFDVVASLTFDHTDCDGVMHHFADQAMDRRGHGSAKKQVLTGWGAETDDTFDIGQKAHIAHAIGLIEYQYVDGVESQYILLQQVFEPTRCTYDDMRTTADRLYLAVYAHTADDDCAVETQVTRKSFELIVDLGREFARWRDDQDRKICRVTHEFLDSRYQKRGGFAGTGVCETQDVAALEYTRDCLVLDGAWRHVAFAGNVVLESVIKGKVDELVCRYVRCFVAGNDGFVDEFTWVNVLAASFFAACCAAPTTLSVTANWAAIAKTAGRRS